MKMIISMLKIGFCDAKNRISDQKLKFCNLILSPENESRDTEMIISMLKIGFCDAKNRFSDQKLKFRNLILSPEK